MTHPKFIHEKKEKNLYNLTKTEEVEMQTTKNVVGVKLAWIVVKDLKAAIEFYTRVVGLTLTTEVPEYGWAELQGPEGTVLGLAAENPSNPFKAGSNAIMTVTVKDLAAACETLIKEGATLLGEVEEVPGHVKMQTIRDPDGNVMQICETL